MAKLEAVEGIGEVYAAKLREVGIGSTEALLQQGSTPKGREELAEKSGTTRNYISRIENDRSDIELDTLRKIIEIGLGKKLRLVIS